MTAKRRDTEQREVAALMQGTGLTSEELGEKLGYHPVVIRQWSSGAKRMSKHARRLVRTILTEQPAKG